MKISYLGHKNSTPATQQQGEFTTRRETLPKHYVEFYSVDIYPQSLFALTGNYSLGYLGLDILNENGESNHYDNRYLNPEKEFFTQSPEEVKEEGLPLDELSGHNAIRYLLEMGFIQ